MVKVVKPQALIIENVSSLRSTGNGFYFDNIIKAMENSGNYKVYTSILNAVDFGVPQFRKRIFFIGVPKKYKFGWPLFTHGPLDLFTNTISQNFTTVKDAIGDLPSIKNNSSTREFTKNPFPDELVNRYS